MNTIPLSSELKSRIEEWKDVDKALTELIDCQKSQPIPSVCTLYDRVIEAGTQKLRKQSKVIVGLIKSDKNLTAIRNVKLNWWLSMIDKGKTEESKGNRRITAVDKFIKMTEGSEK